MIIRAETLRHINGKSLCKSLYHTEHQPVQPVRSADRRQSMYAQRLTDNSRVHHSIKLLKYITEHQRDRKGKNQLCRYSLRHILYAFTFCHSKTKSPFYSLCLPQYSKQARTSQETRAIRLFFESYTM